MSSPTLRILTAKDFVQKPWKNGGGSTEELLVFPQSENFALRMSVALIESSGPFSKFEGMRRILIPLEGKIALSHNNEKEAILQNLVPHSFDGDWQTSCSLLSDKARDFNIIFDPKKVSAHAEVFTVKAMQKLHLIPGRNFIYCVQGNITIEGSRLGAHSLAELPNPLLEIQAIDNATMIVVLIDEDSHSHHRLP